MPAKNASSEKQRSKHYAPRISSPQPAASTNLLNATSIEQVCRWQNDYRKLTLEQAVHLVSSAFGLKGRPHFSHS